MIRKLLYSAILMMVAAPAMFAQMAGDWKIYPTFNNYNKTYANKFVEKVIDTPNCVYILGLGQPVSENAKATSYLNKYAFLYVYDKNAEELLNYNKRNYLSETIVNFIDYNAEKGYLLIVYDNSNIDLLFDNGDIKNIPGLAATSLASSKAINSVSFDTANNLVYLATDFGYIVLDDKKCHIRESHIYNKKLTSIGRVGDYLVAFDEDKAYLSPVDTNHLTFETFSPVDAISKPTNIMVLDNNNFAYQSGWSISKGTINADGTDIAKEVIISEEILSTNTTNGGYLISGNNIIYRLKKDGSIEQVTRSTEDSKVKSGSWDMKNFWFCHEQKGLTSKKFENDTWVVTRDYIAPNVPNVLHVTDMTYNKTYGMLLNNHGIDDIFQFNGLTYPMQLCGYKNHTWKQYGPIHRGVTRTSISRDPAGLVVDPDDDKYVYVGSYYDGISRINLEDPNDILHMARPGDSDRNQKGFVSITPNDTKFGSYCNFRSLTLDNDGNLWAVHHRVDEQSKGIVMVWPAQYRRAGDAKDRWIRMEYPYKDASRNTTQVLPLRHANNKNLFLLLPNAWDNPILVIDHKGTLDNTADDQIAQMGNIYDQDGNTVKHSRVYQVKEDPETGLVWCLTFNGVFTFNPRDMLTNPTVVNRIKVSRNDGTNLADYLLDNTTVYNMTIDGVGRKWFSTNGGGVVCTSSDGKEIYGEFTTDNSYIPDNIVYSVEYNPENASILVSTAKGMAEFFPAGAKSEDEADLVNIYPNPVRPEYLGWITISGLPDGSLVKIADAQGNIVKELGLSTGGQLKWDASNMENKRVRTGVYYVLASSGSNDTNFNQVSKILVVN